MVKEKIAYIRQDDRKYEKNSEKWRKLLRRGFLIVGLESIKEGKIIVIPKLKKHSKFADKRITNQINKYIKQNEIKYVFMDKTIKNSKIDLLKIPIVKEKVLMKQQVLPIFNYIFNINKEIINMQNIYIFVNEYSNYYINIIKQLINEFKTVNIITENISKYRRIENILYKEGILITVSNNKSKSARNARYIINMDLDGETLAKYKINPKAIVINMSNELLFFDKSFNGVVVNDYAIELDKNEETYIEEFYGNIEKKQFVESRLLLDEEKKYETKISYLIGTRGILPKNEFNFKM